MRTLVLALVFGLTACATGATESSSPPEPDPEPQATEPELAEITCITELEDLPEESGWRLSLPMALANESGELEDMADVSAFAATRVDGPDGRFAFVYRGTTDAHPTPVTLVTADNGSGQMGLTAAADQASSDAVGFPNNVEAVAGDIPVEQAITEVANCDGVTITADDIAAVTDY